MRNNAPLRAGLLEQRHFSTPAAAAAETATPLRFILCCPAQPTAWSTGQLSSPALGPMAHCVSKQKQHETMRACSGAGKYAKLDGGWYKCTDCDAGTYRSGDASPTNNVCLAIPAGALRPLSAQLAPEPGPTLATLPALMHLSPAQHQGSASNSETCLLLSTPKQTPLLSRCPCPLPPLPMGRLQRGYGHRHHRTLQDRPV